MQCQNGGPAARRKPDNSCAVLCPTEMVKPFLSVWIKKRHDQPGQGISGMRLSAFGAIAGRTSEA